MARKTRTLATAAFVEGLDADLINWFEALPKGARNQAIKDALRVGLGLGGRRARRAAAVEDDMTTRKLEQLESEYRQKMAWVDQWIEYLNSRVEQVAALPAAPVAAQVVEETPRLAESEKAERAARLKKANW
jgi:hypothetical protein